MTKEHKETSEGDGYVHDFKCCAGFTGYTHLKTHQGFVLQLHLNKTVKKLIKNLYAKKTKKEEERKSPDEGLLMYALKIHPSFF